LLGIVVHGNSLDGLVDTIFDDLIDFSKCIILVVLIDDAQDINYKITDGIFDDVYQ